MNWKTHCLPRKELAVRLQTISIVCNWKQPFSAKRSRSWTASPAPVYAKRRCVLGLNRPKMLCNGSGLVATILCESACYVLSGWAENKSAVVNGQETGKQEGKR